MGTRRLSILGACCLVPAFSLIVFCSACGKGTTTPEPPVNPPKKKVRVLITVLANYVLSRQPASGTVTFQPQGEGATVKNLGEQADLYEIDEGTTKLTTITIEAAGALKRVFKNVPLSGIKKITTTVLELQDFYYQYFVYESSPNDTTALIYGGYNSRWDPENMTVYICPPHHPSARAFTEGGKAYIRDMIYRFQAASRGHIKTVNIIEADLPDTEPPAYGELRIFPTPPSYDTSGYLPQLNITWPEPHVDRAITWIIEGYWHELQDALCGNNQNGCPYDQIHRQLCRDLHGR